MSIRDIPNIDILKYIALFVVFFVLVGLARQSLREIGLALRTREAKSHQRRYFRAEQPLRYWGCILLDLLTFFLLLFLAAACAYYARYKV
jgi:flagellar biosynthesis protein FliP